MYSILLSCTMTNKCTII